MKRGAGRRACCRPGYSPELCSLYEELLSPRFFGRSDCLNSDGRRLLARLARMLVEEHPEHRRLAARALREPCLERLAAMAELSFYACSSLAPYVEARGLRGPYRYPWEP